MKKKIVMPTVLALLMLFAVLPVVAEPTKGQKVPASAMFIPLDTEVPDYWQTNGDIGQGRGGQESYIIILNIGGTITTESVTVVFDEMVNFKSDMFVRRYSTIDSGIDDGFSGNVKMKIYNYYGTADVHYIIHCVLQGFGDNEGQKLMLSYEGTFPLMWTGYCLKG